MYANTGSELMLLPDTLIDSGIISVITPNALAVYYAIRRYDEDKLEKIKGKKAIMVYVSPDTILELTGLTRKEYDQAIEILRKVGWLEEYPIHAECAHIIGHIGDIETEVITMKIPRIIKREIRIIYAEGVCSNLVEALKEAAEPYREQFEMKEIIHGYYTDEDTGEEICDFDYDMLPEEVEDIITDAVMKMPFSERIKITRQFLNLNPEKPTQNQDSLTRTEAKKD